MIKSVILTSYSFSNTGLNITKLSLASSCVGWLNSEQSSIPRTMSPLEISEY
jgi:hypothetical protein